MSISDPQYQAWLGRDNEPRVILVEAAYHDGVSEKTVYMATRAFVSAPTDTPPNTPYDDTVTSIPAFTRRMTDALVGQTTQSWGDVEILNAGGEFDDWLTYAWDGRALRLYIGSPDWHKADFRLMLNGFAADISARDAQHLVLKARDKSYLLNVPAQTTLVGGVTANLDQPVPICMGECFNTEPVLIDSALHKYKVHEGPIEAISQVYDNGLPVAGYTPDLANGEFALTSAAYGRITADVKGAKPDGVYLTTAAQMVEYLVTNHSALSAVDLDSANFAAFAVTCPQALGLYVRERDNLTTVLDSVLKSVGGWRGFNRAGLLQLGRLEAPTGTPQIYLDPDDVEQFGLSIKRRDLPIRTVRLGYRKNYTIQTDGVATTVTEARRADLAAGYLVAKSLNSVPQYLTAAEPDVEETLLVSQAAALAEAARRATLSGQVRTIYTMSGFSAPFQIDFGMIASLAYPRFGFDAGASAVVVGLEDQPSLGRVKVELYK